VIAANSLLDLEDIGVEQLVDVIEREIIARAAP
jgi:hypothetical protein